MAACRSLSSLFEQPMPDAAPTLLESLSPWNTIVPKRPIENGCFTELFGELHFQENSSSKTIPSPHCDHLSPRSPAAAGGKSSLTALLGFSSDVSPLKCSDKLQLCTESLGSESSDDVDDLMQDDGGGESEEYCACEGAKPVAEREEVMIKDGEYSSSCSDVRPRTGRFPPPISSIGRSGKPWFYFKPYREAGRFVLREIRIPKHEFLHASREDGRLKLQLVLPGEEIPEGNEEEEEIEVISEDNGDW